MGVPVRPSLRSPFWRRSRPFPFLGCRTAEVPFLLRRSFLYNIFMDLVDDIVPIRKDIDDHIDEWDELGID